MSSKKPTTANSNTRKTHAAKDEEEYSEEEETETETDDEEVEDDDEETGSDTDGDVPTQRSSKSALHRRDSITSILSDFSAHDVRRSQIDFRQSVTSSSVPNSPHSTTSGISHTSEKIGKKWKQLYKSHLHLSDHVIEYTVLDANTASSNSGVSSPAAAMNDIPRILVQKPNEEAIDYEYKINVALNRVKALKLSTPYCFYVSRVQNIAVPIEILQRYRTQTDNAQLPQLDYRVQLTLYHIHSRQFIGRTCKSNYVGRSKITTVEKTQTLIKETARFSLPVVFHTPIVDDSVVIVMEVVAGVRGRKGALVAELSMGWTVVRIFKDVNFGKTLDRVPLLKSLIKRGREGGQKSWIDETKAPQLQNIPFYLGTPRALPMLREPVENDLVPRLGCSVFCNLYRHSGLKVAMHLLKPNDLCDMNSEIPGLHPQSDLLVPEPLPTTAINISKLVIDLPPNFDSKLLALYEDNRKKEHGAAADVEASCTVAKRELLVGAHNGCSFIKPPVEATLIEATHDADGDVKRLAFEGSLQFSTFLQNKLCGIVMELRYVINVPDPKITRKQPATLFGSGKKSSTTAAQKTFKQMSFVVGAYVFFPAATQCMREPVSIACNMMTGPMRSFTRKLIYALPVVTDPTITKKPVIGLKFRVAADGVAVSQPPTPKAHSVSIGTATLERRPTPPLSSKNTSSVKSTASSATTSAVQTPKSSQSAQSTKSAFTQSKQPSPTKIPPPSPAPVKETKQEQVVPQQKPVPGIKLDRATTVPANLDISDDSSGIQTARRVELARSQELSQDVLSKLRGTNGLQFDTSSSLNSAEALIVHEIHIQFLSMLLPSKLKRDNVPNSVFFRFQFFTQNETNTKDNILQLKKQEGRSPQFALLQRADAIGADSTLDLCFIVDPSQMPIEEYSRFNDYLRDENLFIDVFDADRLFKFGTIVLPLKELCRTDQQAHVQCTREFDLIDTVEDIVSISSNSSRVVREKAKVHVRLANIGRRSSSQVNIYQLMKEQHERSPFSTNKVFARLLTDQNDNLARSLNSFQGNSKHVLERKIETINQFRQSYSGGGDKEARIKRHLEEQLTERRLIFVSAGRTFTFQTEIFNPVETRAVYKVEIDGPQAIARQLTILSDLGSSGLGQYQGKLTTSQISATSYDLIAIGIQKLYIRFKFQSFDLLPEIAGWDLARELAISIRDDRGTLVRLLTVKLVPRRPHVQHFLQFNTIQGYQFSKDVNVLCSQLPLSVRATSDALVSMNPSSPGRFSIQYKAQDPGKPAQFYVFIFKDVQQQDLLELWQVELRWLQCHVQQSQIGQTNAFLIKPSDALSLSSYSNLLAASSLERELIVKPPSFGGDVSLKAVHRTMTSDEVSDILVHLVDPMSRNVAWACIVRAQGQSPDRTRISDFETNLTLGQSDILKIAFTNGDTRTTYTLSTNCPNIVRIAEKNVTLEPGEIKVVYLKFLAQSTPSTVDNVLVFVNS